MPRTYARKNPESYSDAPKHKGPGREPWLTHDEEFCIVESLKFLAQCGYPFDHSDVSNLIFTYFNSPNSRESPFGRKPPGSDYLRNFEKRWAKELTKRKPELLTTARAANLTTKTVTTFFDAYTHLIETNGLQQCPNRIFNVDEAGLATQGKTMFSVLFGISASGNYMPPFTIYKGAHLYESWTKGGSPGALYACTESGWIQDSVFESLMDHFIKYTENLQKPVLLIYDGHGSHMTYGTVKKAIDIILCLPPHTSHALQPLDVGQLFECIRPQNTIKVFLVVDYIQEVEKRIVLTEISNPIHSSEQQINQNQDSEPSTSTCNSDLKQADILHVDNPTIASPLKDLKQAILATLSPPISTVNERSKQKKKRVQAKTGEVLTEETVALRLQKEHEERESKKKKVQGSKPPLNQLINTPRFLESY
ncbi:hypothetical protein HNY73_018463 [Argiope bruennichi]|uniref:DDE-1 domain-containing protein n=1 Tax=Argiope bruennichi TaxID=94029 RepID=A0A8T0EEB9_ARGBR|nr:hypothetical protein HNY73_018463 [Argiope bruennichi]